MTLKHILILEDENFHATILQKLVCSVCDADVSVVANGREALAHLEVRQPDIIFVDLCMPDMDGVEFIRHIAQTKLRPFIVLTSSMTNDVQNAVIDMSHSYGFEPISRICKPVSKEAVSQIIDHWQHQFQSQSNVTPVKMMQVNEEHVRYALLHDEFEPFFQGHYCAKTGKLIGAEALVRWRHPEFGLIPPDRFLPIVIEQGLSYALSCKMLRYSVEEAVKWHRAGQHINVSINISPSDIEKDDFADKVLQIIEQARFPANKLTLEVTEVEVTKDLARSLDNTSRLRMRGVTLSIDDFGTGYSSINQLISSPFSELKIDRLFIDKMSTSHKHFAALQCIINLAQSLELRMVAEGIETQAQAKMLAKLGCHSLQGYYFNKPMSAEAFFNSCVLTQLKPHSKANSVTV
ncbi:two-component system response regulator [Vibrio sp. LaRot3]|uniref:two-component system response regulator n=1 Tax=Vibrio sp. LaRot3 TaxID=2998829 RepID=UPI0022CE05DB|nr:EAL domain-containing response regulator [Vibrio sp. LaRot3]MDA0148178.1 EAL domain-containing response regulator [Vibrio sp. LaRot3]